MKKNLIILILTIITIVSVVFAFNQMEKAKKQEAIANEYLEKIEEDLKIRKKVADMAEKQAKELRVEAEKIRKEAEHNSR